MDIMISASLFGDFVHKKDTTADMILALLAKITGQNMEDKNMGANIMKCLRESNPFVNPTPGIKKEYDNLNKSLSEMNIRIFLEFLVKYYLLDILKRHLLKRYTVSVYSFADEYRESQKIFSEFEKHWNSFLTMSTITSNPNIKFTKSSCIEIVKTLCYVFDGETKNMPFAPKYWSFVEVKTEFYAGKGATYRMFESKSFDCKNFRMLERDEKEINDVLKKEDISMDECVLFLNYAQTGSPIIKLFSLDSNGEMKYSDRCLE